MAKKRKNKAKIKAAASAAMQEAFQDHDTGTPEIHQRAPTEVYGQERKKRARVLNAPLDYYYSKGQIDRDQHSAGRQFLKLYQAGGSPPNAKGMDLMSVRGVSGDGGRGAEMREMYRKAVECFQNPQHRRIVIEVVCTGEYAGAAYQAALREMVAPFEAARKGMKNLRSGLDDLTDHFTAKRSYEGIKKNIDGGCNEK